MAGSRPRQCALAKDRTWPTLPDDPRWASRLPAAGAHPAFPPEGVDMKARLLVCALVSSLASWSAIADMVVPMPSVNAHGIGPSVGQITVSQSRYGLVFTPDLKGLAPGLHGFHVHQNPDCGPKEKDGKMVAALAAGGHYEPEKTFTDDPCRRRQPRRPPGPAGRRRRARGVRCYAIRTADGHPRQACLRSPLH